MLKYFIRNTRNNIHIVIGLLFVITGGIMGCQHSMNTYPLKISSLPPDAKVYINERYKGNTPLQLSNIKEQWYVVRIEKDGYLIEETEVWGGDVTSYTYSLTPRLTTARSKYTPMPARPSQQVSPNHQTLRPVVPTPALPLTSDVASESTVQRKKVALVVGNSDYSDAPLRNPVHDANDMTNILRTLGFQVMGYTNMNQQQMETAIQRFSKNIGDGNVALFYFSGHGSQVDGENYLLPVHENIQSESDIRYKSVNAGYILGKMEESKSRTNIIILDACRNNPYKGFRSFNKGLNIMTAPGGTFIAYATAPGSVALDGTDRNGIYTKYLLEAIQQPGLSIEQVFKRILKNVETTTNGKQIPWTSSSLREDFYFRQ